MCRLLLLVDRKGIHKSAFNFACHLADLTHSTLNGLFIDPEPFPKVKNPKKLYGKFYIGSTSIVEDLPEEYWTTQLAENLKTFESACGERNIRCAHVVNPVASVREIINASRFADLLIVHATASLKDIEQLPPTRFVKAILVDSECPVVIAPSSSLEIREILFAYDGSASAVYAIKQFTYLFPELSDVKAIIYEVRNDEVSSITDYQSLSTFINAHYSEIGYKLVRGKASGSLFSYLTGRKDVFVVTGAYGRKAIAPLLRKSTAETLLEPPHVPIFITHR